ncbi:MAG: hypothetical protein IIA41_08670, partial [SAR324 cluster bacterium]|nr:hypothetical protein [SAR324 cluster bacterium]
QAWDRHYDAKLAVKADGTPFWDCVRDLNPPPVNATDATAILRRTASHHANSS